MRKHGFGVSDQVRQHTHITIITENGKGLKFWIFKEIGLYYPCSENKRADQLHCLRAADLNSEYRGEGGGLRSLLEPHVEPS